MSDYLSYIPASTARRSGAFITNLILLGMLLYPFRYLGIDANKEGTYNCVCLILILLFCMYPESPGKRLLNLKLLDEKQSEIGTRKRILRAIPYLIIFLMRPLSGLFADRMADSVFSVIYLLSLVFISANALAIVFSPESHSLLDMKLGTRVMTPRPIPGQEIPSFMGVKFW